MSRMRSGLRVAAAFCLLAAAAPADEEIRFHSTPSEYEWQMAVRQLMRGDPYDPAQLRPNDPVEWKDLYELPHGQRLDVDNDGELEILLAIHHPAACDVAGCDLLVFGGDEPDLRLEDVLHVPLKASAHYGVAWIGGESHLMSWMPYIVFRAEVDGVPLDELLARRVGADIVTERLELDDLGFASHDLDGDGLDEVFLFVEEYAQCGVGGCGSVILSYRRNASDLTAPDQVLQISPPDRVWSRDTSLPVSPHMVRGWHVLRGWHGCYVWLNRRYFEVSHATYRAIPVQGCFG